MTRVKNGTIHRARRKKIMKRAKGFFGSKHRLYRTAKEQVMHSLSYAYRDRRNRKRDFRKLWITRINAACREHDLSYSKFMHGLTKAEVNVNRKMLAEMAVNNEEGFANLVQLAKDALAGKELKKPTLAKTDSKKETTKKATEKKETTKKQVSKKEETEDLSSKTVAELKKMAKEKNITGYSTMKKADLLKNLK